MRLDFKSIQVSADFDLDVLKRTFFFSLSFRLSCRVGWGEKTEKGLHQYTPVELWRVMKMRTAQTFRSQLRMTPGGYMRPWMLLLVFLPFFRVSNTRTASFLFDIKKKGAILQQGHYSSNNTRRVIDSRQVQTKSRLVNIESGKRSQSVRFTSS